MPYYIDSEKVKLDDVRKRIEATDLVTSRSAMLDGIGGKLNRLEQYGILTLVDLRKGPKSAKRLETATRVTGIDMQYLILLRRETESWFPKPFALKVFAWLPKEEIAKLEKMGISNTGGQDAYGGWV